MDIRFADKKLDRLETDLNYTAGFGRDIVKAYRKILGYIRAAPDERAFYGLKSLHYEKLHGDRKHQRSMRLNKQFRLVLEIDTTGDRAVVIVSVEDYH